MFSLPLIERDNLSFRGLCGEMFRCCPHSLPQIFVGSDVVAIEDCARPMAADCHRNTLAHAGTDQISNSRPTMFGFF